MSIAVGVEAHTHIHTQLEPLDPLIPAPVQDISRGAGRLNPIQLFLLH